MHIDDPMTELIEELPEPDVGFFFEIPDSHTPYAIMGTRTFRPQRIEIQTHFDGIRLVCFSKNDRASFSLVMALPEWMKLASKILGTIIKYRKLYKK